jgi:uncharacterized protein (TIGR02996 family)
MGDRFVRHAKMTAWGLGIVVEDRGGQRTVLFADGQKRTFKGAIADKLLVDAEPADMEERLALERGRAGGAPVPVNVALEAQLVGFDDPQPFLVYADWLQQRGDPRGELIVAQHRNNAKLANALLKEHGDALLPPRLNKRGTIKVEWNLGFISSVRIGTIDDIDELLVALLEHPSAMLVRELVLDGTDYGGHPLEVIANMKPRHLAAIVLGGAIETNALATGDIAAALALPSLTALRATGDRVLVTKPLVHDKLAELAIVTRRADEATLRHAVTGALPALTSLVVDCLDGIDDAPPQDAFAKLPALRTLELRNTTNTRDWFHRIVVAPFRPSLVELRLPFGDLDDDAARELVALRDRLPVLEVLDVSNNRLSPRGEAAVATVAAQVSAKALPHDRWRTPRSRTPPPITPAAQAIAYPKRWDALGIDVTRDRVWGSYAGTNGTYAVAIDRGTDWSACSCPSNERPCKHALALHAMIAAHADIAEAAPPTDHYARTSRKRYTNSWE